MENSVDEDLFINMTIKNNIANNNDQNEVQRVHFP